jgi:hypothetical protein
VNGTKGAKEMPAYVVDYDLQQPGQNYPRLSKAIENKYGTHWHMLKSTWIVLSTESTKQIYEYLAPNIDQNDKLFVGRLSGEAAWYGCSAEDTKWLQSVLSS